MMNNSDKYNLLRFVEAQEAYGIYDIAVSELERGRKRSHWIWFVFPQMKGLGYSYNSNFYGITCREETEAYLENKILNERLRKVCRILLEQVRGGRSVHQILGGIDSYKVKSCLTLFDAVLPNDIFVEWLDTAHYLIYCVRISLVLLSEVCGRKSKLCFYNLVVGES